MAKIVVFFFNLVKFFNSSIKFCKEVIWEKKIYRLCKFIYRIWYRFFWKHILWIRNNFKHIYSFYSWKFFPSKASQEEKEKYILFVESLGGWGNVITCSCCVRSWHFKVIHTFLIDWEKLNQFGMEILFWEWPYLKLAPRSYSKWIFKRLKIFTNMPWDIHKKYKKSIYHDY